MNIVAIADTHGEHEQVRLPDGDVLIHAGDFCSEGTTIDAYDFISWIDRMRQFDERIVIAGNHDRPLGSVSPDRHYVLDYLDKTCVYLEDESFTY
jgi:3',5'-cyclic AMP phosphodiesterase CpdA